MKGLPRSRARGSQYVNPITKLRIPVRNLAVAVANGSSAPGIGSAVVGGLPQGNLLFLGAIAYLRFTSTDADVTATFEGDFSIGTAASADATLSGSEVDLIPSTAMGPAVAKVTPVARGVSTDALGGGIIDNTGGDLELNLNVLIDDASQSGAVDLTVDGFVEVVLVVLADD